MFLKLYQTHTITATGYIAGSGDGIVTAGGVPAVRKVCLLNVQTLEWVKVTKSLANGRYLFMGLEPSKKYLVMVRDLPPTGSEQGYEPFCWDYVTPATDLTIAEQQQLWDSWQ